MVKSTANWQPLIEWGNLIIFATFLQGIIFSIIFLFLPLFLKRFPAIKRGIKVPFDRTGERAYPLVMGN